MQGISLSPIDIVASRSGNLHNRIMDVPGHRESTHFHEDASMHAAYRPIVRNENAQIELWMEPLALDRKLPKLPLALNAETCVSLDLEATYMVACQRRRIS